MAEKPLVELLEADHRQWPAIEVSPHSTPTLQLAPQEWRLELEGIGWFRATSGERLEWQRWDDSVSDRDIRTFAVTSGLGAFFGATPPPLGRGGSSSFFFLLENWFGMKKLRCKAMTFKFGVSQSKN